MGFKTSAGRRSKLLRFLLIAAAAAAVIWLAGAAGRHSQTKGPRAATNEKRVEFIRSLGWEAVPDPLTERKILLPGEFPEVLRQYNDMQLQQGFDLAKYAGKEITMVTYSLLDHPDGDDVQCTLYLYKGRIIGGDIHSPSFTGFMKPLR